MKKIESAEEVVTALGGTHAVAKLTGRGVTAVCNWRARKIFPSNMYATMSDALRRGGHEAPRSLWRMTEAKAAASEVAPSSARVG